jgi:biofilm PGA synthesis protein PgaD
LPAISRFLATLEDYGIVILVNCAVLIAWAIYNQVRFHGQDRRSACPLVSVEDLAQLYGFPSDDIARWQQSRILVMHHGPDGTLLTVIAKYANHPPTKEPPLKLVG